MEEDNHLVPQKPSHRKWTKPVPAARPPRDPQVKALRGFTAVTEQTNRGLYAAPTLN